MPDIVAFAEAESAGYASASRRCTARVWALDDPSAQAAEEHLRHSLWPYWYRFKVTDVDRVVRGESCPLRADAPAVVAFTRNERWMWVLVPQDGETTADAHEASSHPDVAFGAGAVG